MLVRLPKQGIIYTLVLVKLNDISKESLDVVAMEINVKKALDATFYRTKSSLELLAIWLFTLKY